jgi:hypothetical protein
VCLITNTDAIAKVCTWSTTLSHADRAKRKRVISDGIPSISVTPDASRSTFYPERGRFYAEAFGVKGRMGTHFPKKAYTPIPAPDPDQLGPASTIRVFEAPRLMPENLLACVLASSDQSTRPQQAERKIQ